MMKFILNGKSGIAMSNQQADFGHLPHISLFKQLP